MMVIEVVMVVESDFLLRNVIVVQVVLVAGVGAGIVVGSVAVDMSEILVGSIVEGLFVVWVPSVHSLIHFSSAILILFL